jgi:hydrogenase-1 operon protein HyaF
MNAYRFPDVLLGPGTQPPEDDGAALDCPLPSGMAAYTPPRLPEPEDLGALGPALTLLEGLLTALSAQRADGPPVVFDLNALDAANRTMLDETLGNGEVSALIGGALTTRIQETRLAGVWWVHPPEGTTHLEIGDLPGSVRTAAFAGAADQVPIPVPLPAGAMNAPAVLIELNAQVAERRSGDDPHVVNLTLLPQTPADLKLLDQVLGTGPVSLLSRGYGSCRVEATRLRHCWRVRHYNSEDRMILDSIEVTPAPVAILAAQEDLEDSAERLAEILTALR